MGATTSYHVEATVNAWMAAAVNAYTKPAYLPTIGVVYDYPKTALSPPCLSLSHIPVTMADDWQGRNVGTTGSAKGFEARALFEVNAWVLNGNPNWTAQLRTLSDIVGSTALASTALGIKDYTVPTAPVATIYKVNLSDLRQVETGRDANLAIERRRWLISYWWVFRG